MSAAHTPGPWQVAKTGPRRVTNSTGIVICNAVLRNCGTAKTGIKRGVKEVLEAEANARLIASAPELNDAGEALLAAADRHIFGDECKAERDAMRAAIAKARGQ